MTFRLTIKDEQPENAQDALFVAREAIRLVGGE